MIYFLASIAAIAGFLFGYDEGVIAVARPLLEKDFPMTPLVGGFMTAAVPLGALLGASIAGPITDRFGRRRVLMTAAALFAIGALIAAGMTATWILVAARLVLGFAIGLAAVTAPLYIAESAPLAIRGALVSTYQLAITVGILASYLTGLAITGDGMWRAMFALGAVPGLLFLIGLVFLPESPRWLVLRGYLDRARVSLQRLRGAGAPVEQELDEIARTARAQSGAKAGYATLLEPTVRPALVVGVGLFFLQQLSGINAVIYYAPEIFNHAGFDSAETQILATTGVGVVNFLTTILAMYLIDKIGRRPLLVLGFIGTAATMATIAVRGRQSVRPRLGRHRRAAALHRVLRDQPRAAAACHDVGNLPVAGARAGHERGIDQQLGLQFRGGVRVPADARRDRFGGDLRDLCGRLPLGHPVHAGAGAGDHGPLARSDRSASQIRPPVRDAPPRGADHRDVPASRRVIGPRGRAPDRHRGAFIHWDVAIRLFGATRMTPPRGLSMSAMRKNAIDATTGTTMRTSRPALRSR